MRAPCKGCVDRVVGCHTDCERYIESVQEAMAAKEREREYKMCEDVVARRNLKAQESIARIKKKRRGY